MMFDSPETPATENSASSDPAKITSLESVDSKKRAGDANDSISKSQRIRNYMEANPEARNVEIVAALESFGVKVGDVSGVKVKLRQQAGKPPAKRAGRPKGSKNATTKSKKVASAGKPASDFSSMPIASKATMTPSKSSSDTSVEIDVLESCVEFIRKAGGVAEAQNALDLIRRFRSL